MARKAGLPRRGFGDCTTMAWLDDKTWPPTLVGGLVFHNWQPETGVIEISGAGEPGVHWWTRGGIRAVFDYCFKTCECQLVVTRNDENAPHLRIWEKLGASFYTIPHLRGRDRSETIATLRDVDFYASRYGGPHGKAQGAEAA